jgi:NADH-quinone oxidoreductase subunit G
MSGPDVVTLTIDGREVRVPKGTLLWQAARGVGVEIPIFCYHPKMPPLGACRMCLVEVEKMPKLTTACTTPVAEGMVVHTESEKTKAAQESVLEFLLINHPLDCPVCDKGGECPLQDQTFRWGPGRSRFHEPKLKYPKPLPLSEHVLLDRERCIMCFRCVRFQSELAGDESLTVLHRGTHSEIGVAPGRTFDSPFSGNTIELCPVGALTSADYRFRARPWDLRVTPSVCGLCPVGCNVQLHVRKQNDVLTRVTSRENLPVDDGWLCDRGRFGYHHINAPERLSQPLVRRGGELRPATYEEAIAEAARLLGAAREAGAVGGVASTHATNEELHLFGRLVGGALRSPHLDHRLDGVPSRAPLGYDAAAVSIEGLERAEVALLVGVHPVKRQPVLDLRLKKAARGDARLVEVSGAETGLGAWATLSLCPSAGEEGTVLLALCAAILEEGLQDTEWVAERTRGVDRFCAELGSYGPEAVEHRLRLRPGSVREAARLVAGARSVSILYDRAAAHAADGRSLLAGATNLALLTGNLGREGAGPMGLVTGPNEQGALDMGVTPRAGGLSGWEMLWAAGEALRGLALLGTQSLDDLPEGERTAAAEALGRLDALVAFASEPGPATERAHVVFPATAYAEKDGTYTNLERRVQRLRPGRGVYGVWPEWEALGALAAALGGEAPPPSSAAALADIARHVPEYAGVSHSLLGAGGLQWPFRDGAGSAALYAEPEWVWRFMSVGPPA